tara:strand:- start:4558 stop:5058 length:501 start_codon:yes stop_codon:yes gene_type:complete
MNLTAKSYTLKLDEKGAVQINDFVQDNNLSPDNFKELFYSLLQIATTPQEAKENIFSETILKSIEIYKNTIEDTTTETPAESYIVNALRTQPHTKEVPAPIADNQVVITCSEKQLNYLDLIRENRIKYREDYRKEPEEEPNNVLIKKMVFNKGTLGNFHELFYTGL